MAIDRAMVTASVSANSATATAVKAKSLNTSIEKIGSDKGGSPELMAPIVGTLVPWNSLSARASREETNIAIIICGDLGKVLRTRRPVTIAVNPTKVVANEISSNCRMRIKTTS